MTTPEFHTFTVEATGDGPSSVASGRLPDPVQTFTVGTTSATGQLTAEQIHDMTIALAAHIERAVGVVNAFRNAIETAVRPLVDAVKAATEEPTDPEAMREAASRLLTAANEAEAGR